MSTSTSIGLSAGEAAWLLSLSESQVPYQLRVGRLSCAVKPRLVSAECVREFFAGDPFADLREVVLQRVLLGEAQPPRLGVRYVRHSIGSLLAAAAPAWWPGTQPNTTFTIRPENVRCIENSQRE
jgi:hypothetical protein